MRRVPRFLRPRFELSDEYSELRRDRSREGVVLVLPIAVSAARLSRTELTLL
jgi:hypothetical protein